MSMIASSEIIVWKFNNEDLSKVQYEELRHGIASKNEFWFAKLK